MNRLHNYKDKPIYYTGKLMKEALEKHMNNIGEQYLTIKDRTFSNDGGDGPWLFCHTCGSGGPFVVSLYGGDYKDPTQIQRDMEQGNTDNYRANAARVLKGLVKRRYSITSNLDGSLNIKPLGSNEVNIIELQEELFEADTHLAEHLICANCGFGCDIAIETMEAGGGIEQDDIDMYGNFLMITDSPTEIEYELDKSGEFKRGKDKERIIKSQRITRDGLMDECIGCWNFKDEFIDLYKQKLGNKDEQKLDFTGALCEDGCQHSYDFYLFRISPREIYSRANDIEYIGPNKNQVKIKLEDSNV